MHKTSLERAKALRKHMTTAERKLWSLVRRNQLGFHFRRQAPLGPFIVDFYCPAAKLVLEPDGIHHDLSDEKDYDKLREEHLKARGLKVVRFKNNEILRNVANVLAEIQAQIESSTACKNKDNPHGH
jgi:very-short-patch-repair endonuclease